MCTVLKVAENVYITRHGEYVVLNLVDVNQLFINKEKRLLSQAKFLLI